MNIHTNSITVAIPTYNSEKFILQVIESIFNQTISINEIIVTDDNSDDGTLNLIQNSDIKQKGMIRVIKNENNFGYAKNWNRCFENCKTKYLVILHHDDLLKSDAIEKQINFLNKYKEFALVGGQEDFIDKNGKITFTRELGEDKLFKKGEIYEFIKETGSYVPCSSVMFDIEKIKEVGFFDENYLATDELYWPKVLTKFPIAVLGEALIKRRIHHEQAEYSDFAKKYDKIIASAYAQYKIAEYEKESLRQKATLKILKGKTARNCIIIALKVFQMQRDISTSVKYLKVSFKEYPKIFFSKFFIKFTIKAILSKIH